MAKKIQKKGKLQQALVLFHYILQLFGCKDLEALSRDLKDPAYEGLNDDHESKLYHELCHKLYAQVLYPWNSCTFTTSIS